MSSASERLRELMAAAQVPNHGEETWEKKMAWDRYNEAYFKLERLMRPDAALPLIADVVEAAERVTALDFPATYIGEIDGVRHYGTSGDAARIIAPALTALRKALNGSAGDGGVT